eukprot:8175811-Ditylum_brightwellii.AAC.1
MEDKSEDKLAMALSAQRLSKPENEAATDSSFRTSLKPCAEFKKVVDASAFNIFDCIYDLGFFGWAQSGPYKSMKDVTSNDITTAVKIAEEPKQAISVKMLKKKCPLPFSDPPPCEYQNKFPYDPSYLVPLYVAVRERKLKLDSIEFMFGGSTLNMLATKEIPDE